MYNKTFVYKELWSINNSILACLHSDVFLNGKPHLDKYSNNIGYMESIVGDSKRKIVEYMVLKA